MRDIEDITLEKNSPGSFQEMCLSHGQGLEGIRACATRRLLSLIRADGIPGPLGEEVLSAAAPPRGGRAASSGRADGVSQGRARGAQHCAGKARSLCPELGRAGRRTRRIQNPERGSRGRPGGGGGGVGGGRAGAQREETASAVPGSEAGEFLIQASRTRFPSPGLPAPARAAGVCGRLGLCCASQLGSSGLVIHLAGGPGPRAQVLRVCAPFPLQLCRDPNPSPATLGSELRAGGNGGALGTARYPPAGSPGRGMPVPGDRCTCPSSTLHLPRCPTLRPNRCCEPRIMAESLAPAAVRDWRPEAGRAPLPKPRSGLASNFAKSLVALSSRGHGGAARTSHFFHLGGIGV
ncbi:pro-resilin-like [Sapajus apella]|uniref:Pro-resilin-like n=1 Tax=Sapajus apella TaxID=9515 RepID=A0A6J3IAB1_SAPAP|nr:pro-resilin-like [Sapajus apella]